MDSAIINSGIRFVLLWVVQVFILKQVVWGWGGQVYLQVHLYPLFILLLPFATPRILTIFLAFLLGIAIDYSYETPGMHAGALVFTAYMRDLVLPIIEPREDYNPKDTPTKASLGATWFLQYAAIMLALHLTWYFFLEAFTIVYWKTIIFKAFFSLVASLFAVLLVMYTANPKS